MKNILRWLAIIVIVMALVLNVSCSHTSYDRLNNPNGQYVTASYGDKASFTGIDYPKGWEVVCNSDCSSANFTGKVEDKIAHINMTIMFLDYDSLMQGLKQRAPDKLLHENLTNNKGLVFSVFGGGTEVIYVCKLNGESRIIYPEFEGGGSGGWLPSTCSLVLEASIGEAASEKEQEIFDTYCIHMLTSLQDSTTVTTK
jgi:hypothetical protein